MKTLHTQRGVAAVEAALLIAVSVVLLPLVQYFSQVIYHAIVLDKAVYSAARVVAALPDAAYAPSAPGTLLPAIGSAMIDAAADEAGLQSKPAGRSAVTCGGRLCQHGFPGVITVASSVHVVSSGFDVSLADGVYLGSTEIPPSYLVSYAP